MSRARRSGGALRDLDADDAVLLAGVDAEMAAARPDPEAREDALLRRLELQLRVRGETIVAFALAGRPRIF